VIARLVRAATVTTLLVGLALGPAAGTTAADAPRTPIEHAVFLMEEGHSFDNLFGSYPGADGTPTGTCVPIDPANPANGCAEPVWVGDRTVTKFVQSRPVFELQFDGGTMNGFVSAQSAAGADAPLVMGYYDGRDVPFSWNLADAYVLFDRFFTSGQGGSVMNHLYWVTGTPGPATDTVPLEGFGDLPTIFDRLQAAGIDWKFYVQNLDRSVNYRNPQGMIDRGSQVERVPLLAMSRYLDNPALSRRIVDLSEYYNDLDSGTLPAVSYVVPSGGGASTPTSIRVNEQLGQSLINALTRSSSWGSSMLLWTYDGWGGWYDHVAPPQVDADGYGFRVPALLVSPYARRGLVDDTQLDFTSIIRFITDNWGLQPLSLRDTTAETFASAFDFANPGRSATFISSVRTTGPAAAGPRRAIIYVVYAAALVVALVLVGVAATRSGRPRRRDQATRRSP
jgi:phospholipase C